MDVFFKSVAAVVIAVFICLILSKQGKDFSVLLTVLICCMVVFALIHYLSPILGFIRRLETMAQMESEFLEILIKSVGIAFISEIMTHICNDAGYGAMGKTLNILASATVLWLSIPLFNSLIDLIEKILVTA